jgi:hypothetical protein
MAASYSTDLSIGLNRARYLLGDTDTTSALLQDDEITGMLALYNFNEAVAQLAMGLASKYAQEPDQYNADGGLEYSFKLRVDAWKALAVNMRNVAEKPTDAVPRPGISVGSLKQPDTSRLRF